MCLPGPGGASLTGRGMRGGHSPGPCGGWAHPAGTVRPSEASASAAASSRTLGPRVGGGFRRRGGGSGGHRGAARGKTRPGVPRACRPPARPAGRPGPAHVSVSPLGSRGAAPSLPAPAETPRERLCPGSPRRPHPCVFQWPDPIPPSRRFCHRPVARGTPASTPRLP
jgi:hypothetical protein